MAAPTLTLLNSTDINDADATTGWTLLDTLDDAIKKEGGYSMTGAVRTDSSVLHYDYGSAPATAVGKTFRAWFNTINVPYIETEANGGYELLIYDGTTTEYVTILSSETYFGGWLNIIFNMDDLSAVTLANVQRWGLRVNHTATAKNLDNLWMDALRYLDGYSMTGGTSGDEITLATIEVADRGTTTLYGYGIITVYGGVFYCTGDVQIGSGATTTYFKMDGNILVFEDKPVAEGLYKLSGVGTGAHAEILNSVIISAGSTDSTRFIFDWSDADLASFSCTGSRIVRAALVTFKSGQTITGTIFNDCDEITISSSTFEENSIQDAAGVGVQVPSTGRADKDNTYSGCLYGQEYKTVGAYTVDGDQFSGNTYDILFSANCSNVNAGSFTVGQAYKISTAGDTVWTDIGAADNNVGTKFIATGIGSGTGVATHILLINTSNGANPTTYSATGTLGDVLINNPINHTLTGLIDGSEVTYTKLPTAEVTGTAGTTTINSRTFGDTTKSWTTDAYKGHLLVIEEGADAGRYYIVSNTATTLKLDSEMSATASALEYSIYNEADSTVEFHEETVTGNSTVCQYAYAADYIVDILVFHVEYEDIVLEDITLGAADASVPIQQQQSLFYSNP